MKKSTKTIYNQNFPTIVVDKIEQGTKYISNIWYGYNLENTQKILWIHSNYKNKLEKMFNRELIDKLEIQLVFLTTKDINFHQKNGNFFSRLYLNSRNQLYSSETVAFSSWCNEMDFDRFKHSYTQKQKLLATYGREFISQQTIACWDFYIKSFQNDCDYLEILTFGKTCSQKTLTKRLLQLERHIPEVKELFVKETPSSYYLIKDIHKDDGGAFNTDWQDAILLLQKKLKQLVIDKMQKTWRKSQGQKNKKSIVMGSILSTNDELSSALKPLTLLPQVEEIYLFYQNLEIVAQNNRKHYYILLITSDTIPETKLQKLLASNNNSHYFTLIQHSRLWIQQYAYEYQGFFKKIITPDNRLYQADFHPVIHWYSNYEPFHDGMSAAFKKQRSFFKKKLQPSLNKTTSQNYFSIKTLHGYLCTSLQLYLHSKASYKPITINLLTLWNLCLYHSPSFHAFDSELKKLPLNLLQYLEDYRRTPKSNLILDATTTKKMSEFFEKIKTLTIS